MPRSMKEWKQIESDRNQAMSLVKKNNKDGRMDHVMSMLTAMPANVAYNMNDVSADDILAVQQAIAENKESYLNSLDSWYQSPCPKWYVQSVRNADTGKIVHVRMVDKWLKHCKAAFNAMKRGEYVESFDADGNLIRTMPMPSTPARLLSLVIAGNPIALCQEALQVLRDAGVKLDEPINPIFVELGASEHVNRDAYRLIQLAAKKESAWQSFKKAEKNYYDKTGMTEYTKSGKPIMDAQRMERRDSAEARYNTARDMFVAAWARMHRVLADDIKQESALQDVIDIDIEAASPKAKAAKEKAMQDVIA